MQEADIGIIGAGVVGCAIARRLVQNVSPTSQQGPSVIVLEKHPAVSMETSRLNSGVIHSGFHQKPGTLKATLAQRGSRLIREYAESRLPKGTFANCGMLIAISKQDVIRNLMHDLSALVHLLGRGREQDIKFKFLGPREVRKLEPHINALGGIFIPEVLVVDPIALTQSLYLDAIFGNSEFIFNSSVVGIDIEKEQYIVMTESGEKFVFRCLINSAGLYADDIARMAGIDKYRIYPWRGEYYEIIGGPSDFARCLVYPAVTKKSPSKGTHFSNHPDGRIFIGPTAKLVEAKNDYDNNRLPKEVFLGAARKFYPWIGPENLIPAYAGIRPKLREDGLSDEDFVISLDRETPPLINLVAIESPGLSASMAIAEYVANILNQVR